MEDKRKIGGFELHEVSYLSDAFGLTRRGAFKWLKTLHVTILHINDRAYFSLEALEITIRVIVESGKAFSMPGSNRRESPYPGQITMTDKMKKRVGIVQARTTDSFFIKEVKLWLKEKEELKQARKELTKLRKVLQEVSQGVQPLPSGG